jgi:hypothetical protein
MTCKNKLTRILTKSFMYQNPNLGTKHFLASQEFLILLWNLKNYYHVHKNPLLGIIWAYLTLYTLLKQQITDQYLYNHPFPT